MDKIIFWDFHGTLAYNDWMVSKALYKVLINNEPNTNIGIDDFKEKGYSNVILSNHIPELPRIVEELGLSPYLIDCISSANVGYEKPNAKIYEHALEKHNKKLNEKSCNKHRKYPDMLHDFFCIMM
jgi:hypothetical protein